MRARSTLTRVAMGLHVLRDIGEVGGVLAHDLKSRDGRADDVGSNTSARRWMKSYSSMSKPLSGTAEPAALRLETDFVLVDHFG